MGIFLLCPINGLFPARTSVVTSFCTFSCICFHRVFLPLWQIGQAFSDIILDRPAPGLKERDQVLLHNLGELPHPQIHLVFVVLRKTREGLVVSEDLDECLPPEALLELERERNRRMTYAPCMSSPELMREATLGF